MFHKTSMVMSNTANPCCVRMQLNVTVSSYTAVTMTKHSIAADFQDPGEHVDFS